MAADLISQMRETIAQRTAALAEAEARYSDLINSLPDALLVFDSNGCFVSVLKAAENNGQLPGLYPGEMPAEGVYGRESAQRFREAITATISTGRVSKLKLQVRRPFDDGALGEMRHFDVRLIRFDEYFALAMVLDTTEEVNELNRLRLAEQRSADAEKRESLTLLAASIAHDMNNVLSVVLNAAESDRADPSGDSAVVLNTIREAVRRGAGMMRELQTYAGENGVTLVRTASHRIVDDIRLLVEPLFPKSILVSYDKAADAPDVDADPDQFWKVIFNIAKNAGEAIGKNRPGRIIIGCARMEMTAEDAPNFVSEAPLPPGPGTVFTVRDDGPGIAAEILPRVFDPYVSSRALGRGLGLATVRTIVEAHGGGLRVTSRLGVGTLFEVFLPESRLPKPDAAAANDAPVAPGERKDVLIVDDETLILRTSAILLKGIGMVPHTAQDNSNAMAIVRRQAKALRAIILDADIGGMDTVRLLASIRKAAPDVPVVVATGSSEEQVAKRFAACPYDAFLSKPYTLGELKAALTRV